MKKFIYICLTFIFSYLLFSLNTYASGYINHNTATHELYIYGDVGSPISEAELICGGIVVERFSNEGNTIIDKTVKYDNNLTGVYSCNVNYTSNGITRRLLENDVNIDFGKNSENNGSNSSDNNQNIDTTGNCSVLGSFKGDLQAIFEMIRIFAPILTAIISVYEYLTALFMKNADELKKANSRLIKRLFLIAALFLLPTFLNIVLDLIDSGDYSTCIK